MEDGAPAAWQRQWWCQGSGGSGGGGDVHNEKARPSSSKGSEVGGVQGKERRSERTTREDHN